jgi:mono/diheme cytochrome c family protein
MSEIPSEFDSSLEPAGASDESIQRVHAELLHTKPEPEPGGYALTPLLLLGFMSGLILACCIFFVHNRGGFNSLVYNGQLSGEVTEPKGPTPLPVIIARGKSLYTQTCVQCHQATGLGVPLSYPPLAGSDIVQGDPERLVRIVLQGLKDPIMVNGVPFVTPNKMPAFSPVAAGLYNWSDLKISYVLTYIRQDFGNKADPITADDVTAIHAKVADRKGEWTWKELPASP